MDKLKKRRKKRKDLARVWMKRASPTTLINNAIPINILSIKKDFIHLKNNIQ